MKKTRISAIAAMDEKRGIGKDNHLLFKISKDFQRMKDLTIGHPIIMGRDTFESKEINKRPLPKRINIVLTRNPRFKANGVIVCHSIDEALKAAQRREDGEIFVFGGGEVYKTALPFIDRLYLTIVRGDFGADTFFPEYEEQFKKVINEEDFEEDGYTFKFLDLER